MEAEKFVLTPYQQQLASDNFHLVEKTTYAWMRRAPILTYDEVHDAVMLALIRSARRFDASLGWQFSTLFGNCVKNTIRNALRDRKAPMRFTDKVPLSLDYIYFESTDDDEPATLMMYFMVEDDQNFLNRIYLDKYLNELTELQRECIIMYYLYELKQYEIADIKGLQQTNVSRHIRVGLKKLKAMMEREV